jgi:NADH-quinone oxidoreductase subunit J
MMRAGLTLFYTFSSFGVLCSFFVISSKNTVYSVFFLMLSFLSLSSLLFLLRLDFLPITFLVIYVGAISILFLFVVMLLNVKFTQASKGKFEYIFLAFIFGFVFILEMFLLARLEISPLTTLSKTHLTFLCDFVCAFSSFSNFFSLPLVGHNARYLGFVVFTEYFQSFIISGFILLLAMVGVIVLTLHKKFYARSQNIFAQVLRNHKTCVTYYF